MDIQQIASILLEAEKTGIACDPVRSCIDGFSIEEAYKIQSINLDKKTRNGASLVGTKIGLTSFAVQKQLGVDQPDFGKLTDKMELLHGQEVSYSELMQPKIEAEIGFILGSDLNGAISISKIISSIKYVCTTLEIVGSRIKNWDINICDTIADNASASHFVVGHQINSFQDLDVSMLNMELKENGKVVSSGDGKACLGSPLNAVYWLAQKMQDLGTPLKAGEIILSGALGPMVQVLPGKEYEAEIGSLGSVKINITE